MSAHGGWPAHRYTPQVTQGWPRGSEPASPCCLWRSVFSFPFFSDPFSFLFFLLFFSCPLFPFFCFFFCPPPPFFFFVHPRCLWRSVFSSSGCLGPWCLVVPPLFLSLLPSCFSLFFCWLFSSSGPCRWCGAGLVCVSWAVQCAGVCFSGAIPVVALCAVLSRPSGGGWCCVVFSCCLVVSAVGPGCPLLSLGGSWCRVLVVLSISRHVARRPVGWCCVFWCSAALCCVLWCCAVVWWCAVVLCCLFVSLPGPVVCFL